MKSSLLAILFVLSAGVLSGNAAFAVPSPGVQTTTQFVGVSVQRNVGRHVAPVDAPIADPFRAPEHSFGPGNRGIEYRTSIGQSVIASASGEVLFAGQVAGSKFVTVDHGGGVVTTVGFLDEIMVSSGQRVVQGSQLGTSGSKTHFSARQDGEYFDPARLFQELFTTVRLVSSIAQPTSAEAAE